MESNKDSLAVAVDQRPRDADSPVKPDGPGCARRLAWSDRLRRVWHEDVVFCSRCGGAMRRVAVIEAPEVGEKILKHVGLWQRGPPRSRHVVVDFADHESCCLD
jgi:hypothetical protein